MQYMLQINDIKINVCCRCQSKRNFVICKINTKQDILCITLWFYINAEFIIECARKFVTNEKKLLLSY